MRVLSVIYSVEDLYNQEKAANEEKGDIKMDGSKKEYQVEFEWIVRAKMPVMAKSLADALNYQPTREEIEKLVASGEYAKGSMEISDAWQNE